MTKALDQAAFEQLFLEARTQNAWKEGEVSDETLRRLFDIVKMGPTSANCSPARYVFVKSPEAKERLKPHLSGGNLEKTMSAPVTVIIANDMEFYEHLPKLFPHTDAKSWFTSNEDLIRETAFRNATLQGGYMIIAARALGLDCGPMSGFDQAGVDEEFFKGTTYKSNFLLNLGHGDPSALFPRSPRFEFEDVASIL
jgi:3-hydroxypropanoate dehydrogenase